jgi:predicted NBD/HSP70 family sugar kinase
MRKKDKHEGSEAPPKPTNLIRHLNEVRCLRLLRRAAPLSRADVARDLGLTRATSGKVIADLMDRGLLIELPDTLESGKAGRPGRNVALNAAGAYFIGIDVSSGWITGVLVDFEGSVLSQLSTRNTPHFANPKEVAEIVADLSRRLAVGAAVSPKLIRGVGISVPGIVNRAGVVVSAKLLTWEDVDLAALVSATLGASWPVYVCNDTVALAAAIGALDTAESPDLLVVLLSEGIGATLIRDGRVSEGADGFAGEIGHMILSTDPEDSGDLSFGVLGGHGAFLPLLPSGSTITEGLIALSARQDSDPTLQKTLDQWSRVMSVGLVNLIHILNPERIVLGGPLSIMFHHVRERVEQAVRLRLLHGLKMPPIDVAGMEANTVAIGAAGTVRDTIFVLSHEHSAGTSLR